MSFRGSTEGNRWLVINKYLELKRKNSNVQPQKVYNFFKFNKHKDIKRCFVYRTIERYNTTQTASDRPRNVKKRKFDDVVRKSVIKQATNKKKPKYQRTLRKISQISHGSPKNKFLNEHLKKKYIPAMKKYKCTRLIMDNDGSHHSKICVKYLNENNVLFSSKPPPPCWRERCRCKPPEGFWFPAYAPEVSPAELYNNYIQQELDNMAQRRGHPSSIENLKQRVHQIVRKTPKSYFKDLMASMPRRVQEMYKANGGK